VLSASLIERTRHFFSQGLWRLDLRPRSLAATAARGLQLAVMIVRGYLEDELSLRAGALTYTSAL